jgi:hypothetical protein
MLLLCLILPGMLFGKEIQQERLIADDNGFADIKYVKALYHGKIEVLKKFGWQPNQVIQGQVLIKERLTPFNKNNPNKDAKIASCGIPCTYQGKQIYRKTIFSFDLTEKDDPLEHDNKDAIREKYKELEAEAAKNKTNDTVSHSPDNLN